MAELLVDGIYEATVLTADSPDAYNDIENPSRVMPKKIALTFKEGITSLPPHSLVIVDVLLE